MYIIHIGVSLFSNAIFHVLSLLCLELIICVLELTRLIIIEKNKAKTVNSSILTWPQLCFHTYLEKNLEFWRTISPFDGGVSVAAVTKPVASREIFSISVVLILSQPLLKLFESTFIDEIYGYAPANDQFQTSREIFAAHLRAIAILSYFFLPFLLLFRF